MTIDFVLVLLAFVYNPSGPLFPAFTRRAGAFAALISAAAAVIPLPIAWIRRRTGRKAALAEFFTYLAAWADGDAPADCSEAVRGWVADTGSEIARQALADIGTLLARPGELPGHWLPSEDLRVGDRSPREWLAKIELALGRYLQELARADRHGLFRYPAAHQFGFLSSLMTCLADTGSEDWQGALRGWARETGEKNEREARATLAYILSLDLDDREIEQVLDDRLLTSFGYRTLGLTARGWLTELEAELGRCSATPPATAQG